ncbi:TPA: hypothetical protein DEW47_04000 [Patescibacteria group bacterium]|nr:MAG: hypothetical protein UT71_C0003G0018 [Parcubacteria group bacterium GW2011_GWF2_40_10]KKR47976.1 MAG: hypothetical protein UT83_C0001G0019 [Parcubacteria group bacterium GW2011_GWA2_40_143]KKR60456.1 MAG: hypothetical protein UT97_C0001G0027 [Parcubacteria group bacterium GW2011_GWC2_40_31]KKR74786.1 MAG: hypothetical protein UU18_C0019G0010 [Parcubacteria group bacterium GW2011_GWB2_40_8]KKR77573.1 MAG: hypothetical protein UU20_C0004G0010 [Parcubacteria group bacterium GW2011_GWE2_40_
MLSKKQFYTVIVKQSAKIILSIVIATIIISYSCKKIAGISSFVAESRAANMALEKRSEMNARLENDFKILGNGAERITNAFPPADNILSFMGALENLAQKQSLSQNLSFSDPNGKAIDYTVTLNGNLITLINYMKDFENLPYFSSIYSLEIRSGQFGWLDNSSIAMKARLNVR